MQRSLITRNVVRRWTAAVSATAAVSTSSSWRIAVRAPLVAVPSSTFTSVRRYASEGGDAPRSGQYLLDKGDVLTRVLEVVKNFEKVDAAKVTPESHFVNDLGLNSLDVVEVVFALEQEFVLDIPDHDAEKIQSIPDAVEYIAQNPMAK